MQRGGTIIRSSRSAEFLDKKVRSKCREFLAREEIKYMIVIGGDGSFRGAAIFEDERWP